MSLPRGRPGRVVPAVIAVALGVSPTCAASFAPPGAGTGEPWLVAIANRPADARVEIEKAGAGILDLVGDEGWLVRATPERAATLRTLPFVIYVAEWSAERKISPSLREPKDPDDEVRVVARLLPGTDPAPWRALIEATPGAKVVMTAEGSQGARTMLTVEGDVLASAVAWLASLRDVAAIDEAPTPVPFLDDANWFLQTSIEQRTNYDLSAKLFARGVNGRGMIGALVDDGLDNDGCQFTYADGINEAAWPLGPSADAPAPVPPEWHDLSGVPPLRTRERKVVAYYVQRGAAPYGSSIQHGTQTARCIVGDAHEVLADRPVVRDLGEDQDVRPYRSAGEWTVGQVLRPDLHDVDDPTRSEPTYGTSYGSNVQHHQLHDGVAPGAQLVLQDFGKQDGEFVAIFQDLIAYQAHGTGATALNESFGEPPGCLDCYLERARDIDEALWSRRDLVACVAVGNERGTTHPQIGGGAAHAKSVVTVGATDPANSPSCNDAPCTTRPLRRGEDVASYSSEGPSSGGRLAPELVVSGAVVIGDSYNRPEDGTGSGDRGCGFLHNRFSVGTSFSCATMTGLSLLVQQYFQDGYYPTGQRAPDDALRPTNALVRAVLVNSARDLGGSRTGRGDAQGHRPNMSQGWGAPRLDDTLYFTGDPTIDDPLGDTERSGLKILTDTPNGVTGALPLAPEPGGRTRDVLCEAFRPALTDGAIHEFVMNVLNADPANVANELRITLAWSDMRGSSASVPLVNDVDLEVISPGPDGILQSATGSSLLGDDVVYRPSPAVAWSGGFTQPAPHRGLQLTRPPFLAFTDRDGLNTVENVFVPASDAVTGQWRVRVIGYSIPGGAVTFNGRPNFVKGDGPPVFDMDGDGVNETDFEDFVDARRQGYALIASGAFTAPPPPPYRGPRWARDDFPGRGRRRPPLGPWSGP